MGIFDLFRKDKKGLNKPEEAPDYECTRCGAILKVDDKFCPKCGDNLEEEIIKAEDKILNSKETLKSADTPKPPETNTIEKDLSMALSQAQNQEFNQSIKLILGVLSKDPENKQALRYAGMVLQPAMTKQNINKLDSSLLDSPLLNPVFAQCGNCRVFWVPDPWLASASVLNPIGGKCSRCAAIFCRSCFKVIDSSIHCPQCGIKLDAVSEPNGRKQQSSSAQPTHPSPDVLIVIVDLMPPDEASRFVNGLVRYMNIALKPETKVLIRQFADAKNLKNVIGYTVGCTYPLKQQLGWDFETDETIFQDFSAQSSSGAISGHVAFLYKKK